MGATPVARALNRAILATLAALVAVACGDKPPNSDLADASAAATPVDASANLADANLDGPVAAANTNLVDANLDANGTDANWAQCATVPGAGATTNTCGKGYFVALYLSGSTGVCNAITTGPVELPLAQCDELCAPLSDDAATSATTVASCYVSPAPPPIDVGGANPYTDEITCKYPPQPGCQGATPSPGSEAE